MTSLAGASRLFDLALDHASIPRYTAFSKKSRLAVSTAIVGSYEEAHEHFYRRFGQKRLWFPPDGIARSGRANADHTAEWITVVSSPTANLGSIPARLIYGLPYTPTSRSKDAATGERYTEWAVRYYGQIGNQRIGRRASPLLLKVMPWQANQVIAVALYLRSWFFGSPAASIRAARIDNRTPPHLKKPPWTAVPGFAVPPPSAGVDAIDEFLGSGPNVPNVSVLPSPP